MERLAKNIPIYYETFGAGRPVIVLHGTPLDHRGVAAALEPTFAENPGWARIYPDLPGHGRTPAPESISTNDQMLDVVLDFIEGVAQGQQFALIGESYGGYLARGVANRLPARVCGLFLWTPAKYPRSERRLPSREVREEDAETASTVSSDEKWIFNLLVIQSKEAMEFMRKHIIPAGTVANEEFLTKVLNTKLSVDLDSVPFEAPTYIVCGRQDAVVGYLDSFETLTTYPRATFVTVDGAGHVLGFTERKQLFKVLVTDWLQCVQNALDR